MHNRLFMRGGIAAAATLFALSPAYGVIIGPGDGSGNTTPTNADNVSVVAGWNNVGTINDASAVYLGNGWAISAYHVAGTLAAGDPVSFGAAGTFYTDGDAVRLQTPGQGAADLEMFHLTATPSLPALAIPISSPVAGTFIYLVGYGRDRAVDPTYYNVTGTDPNLTWTEVSNAGDANAGGFDYAAGSAKRWGTNTTTLFGDPASNTAVIDVGSGPTQVFVASFYDSLDDEQNGGGTAYESQVANGDSGGGAFDAANNLIGLLNYKGTYSNQPDDTAVFSDESDMADLSLYRDQILATLASPIPEPASLALLGLGGLALLTRRRRA